MDAALAKVLSEMDGIFTLRRTKNVIKGFSQWRRCFCFTPDDTEARCSSLHLQSQIGPSIDKRFLQSPSKSFCERTSPFQMFFTDFIPRLCRQLKSVDLENAPSDVSAY